jgi:hypothetical protein
MTWDNVEKNAYTEFYCSRGRVVMTWFRLHIRLGARLALFALAVQIVLSFGHVHFYSVTAPAKPALAAAQQSDTPLAGAPDPVDKSDRVIGSDCAICALIQLSASPASNAAPALPPPLDLGPSELHPSDALALAASPHFLFNPRAPPSI